MWFQVEVAHRLNLLNEKPVRGVACFEPMDLKTSMSVEQLLFLPLVY